MILALLGCTESGGAPGGAPVTPWSSDAGTLEPDADDAAVADPMGDRTRALVDPRDLVGVGEQPPLPARMVFIEDSHLALGAAYDPDDGSVGPVCVTGAERLHGGGSGSVSSWAPTGPLYRDRLVGFEPSPLELQEPPELEAIVQELNSGSPISISSDRFFTWGAADLAPDGYAWSESPECEGLDRVVYQLSLSKRRFSRFSLAFADGPARDAFVDAHGSDLYWILTATGLERARLERELADVAVVRVFHFQIGGDRASTEAVLASHRCSVTELAACAELMDQLDALSAALADEPAPEPGNYHGWVPARGFEGRFR